MSTTIAITNKVDDLIDTKKQRFVANSKEGFVHSILVLALSDEEFLKRAQEFNKYLGDEGVTNYEGKGL